MALGASEGSVSLLVLRQGMTVVLSGVALAEGLAVLVDAPSRDFSMELPAAISSASELLPLSSFSL